MSSPNITNIIVVMLENRSYDNVLGWLYNSGNQPPYNQAPSGQSGLNGLTGSESNPNPNPPPATITVSNATATTVPEYDPGELFSDMAQQIFGLSSPATSNPWTSPPPTDPGMQGFTTNYSDQTGHLKVPQANYPDVMTYLTPAQVPVSAWLANNFAVCDQWFASVPCQTFTNRVFALCAAPGVSKVGLLAPYSMVDDMQYLLSNPSVKNSMTELASMFSILDTAFPPGKNNTPNWKVYFHDYCIAMLTVPYVYDAAISSSNANVATFDNTDWGNNTPAPFGTSLGAVPATFLDDLANGTLPKVAFIEPRYSSNVATNSLPPNSNHPGNSEVTLIPDEPGTPIDVANGEAFLMQLYNAIQSSSIWNSCLLIITYDEHGGTYDHVPPPPATPPGTAYGNIAIPAANNLADPAADGFNFNYFGGRVPAIVVSPLITAGSTITPLGSVPFDHTSIIATVWDCFGLSSVAASLTSRDANAPNLMPFLTGTNSTGQYDGPGLAAAQAQPSKIALLKTPEEAKALLRARLFKSAGGQT